MDQTPKTMAGWFGSGLRDALPGPVPAPAADRDVPGLTVLHLPTREQMYLAATMLGDHVTTFDKDGNVVTRGGAGRSMERSMVSKDWSAGVASGVVDSPPPLAPQHRIAALSVAGLS
jgi:hypothetical protein